MSKLLIVESPSKAKTITRYLGSDYEVKASMGHLRDLPKKKIGVDPDKNFEVVYEPIEGKDKLINELKTAANAAEKIYLATDPDREGEAISWHLSELLKLDSKKTSRVTFNEITKPAVTAAVEHPRDIDLDLVNAQQARRILDRIVGYKLSPFLWKKVRPRLSAGRVQSVVTRLVVDREREIKSFVPEEYWTVDAHLAAKGKKFTAYYYGVGKRKVDLKCREDVDKILEKIKDAEYTVSSYKTSSKKRQPTPPFITSTLQQDASRRLSMPAKRVMKVAQELYEGVDIEGRGLSGLVTYIRTDSLRVSDMALSDVRGFIADKYGKAYLPQKARYFRTKEGAQDAHEAIRPTDPKLTPELVKKSLTPDQYKLYKLIWSRFVASQMSDAVFDTASAEITANGCLFKASGSNLAFQGFLAVYEESTDDEAESESALPVLSEGQVLDFKGIEEKQHFTQPPARYTEASLIKAMEEKGIGRPSTYAPTISVILDREYVVKEGKALRPSALGEAVTDLMEDRFSDIVDVGFTADMEDKLDDIEKGKTDYREVLRKFYDGFTKELSAAEKEMERKYVKVPDEESDVVCEKCGRKMVIKIGRFGKFLACPGYPECKNTKPLSQDAGAACPKCGAKLLKKKSKSGYYYFGCEKNPECDFMTWDTLTNRKCPKCGGVLYRHYTKEEKKILCHVPGCGYEEEIAARKRSEAKDKKTSETAKKTTKAKTAKTAKTAKKKSADER